MESLSTVIRQGELAHATAMTRLADLFLGQRVRVGQLGGPEANGDDLAGLQV